MMVIIQIYTSIQVHRMLYKSIILKIKYLPLNAHSVKWVSCEARQWTNPPFSWASPCLHTWLDFQECYLYCDNSIPIPSFRVIDNEHAPSWTNQISLISEMGIVATSQSPRVARVVTTQPMVVSQPYAVKLMQTLRELVCRVRERRMQTHQKKCKGRKWEREREENQTCWLIDLMVPLLVPLFKGRRFYLLTHLLSYSWFQWAVHAFMIPPCLCLYLIKFK